MEVIIQERAINMVILIGNDINNHNGSPSI